MPTSETQPRTPMLIGSLPCRSGLAQSPDCEHVVVPCQKPVRVLDVRSESTAAREKTTPDPDVLSNAGDEADTV